MNELLDAIHAVVPAIDFLPIYKEETPPDEAQPPWLILTTSIGADDARLSGRILSHTATLEARIATLTATQANIAALTLLDAVTGATPHADGFTFGAAVLSADSGTYLAGTDMTPVPAYQTGGLWNVRVLRWKILWSRS